MTIMRVYAAGVLKGKRAQEDSAVEDAKAALQAAGTPLLNLTEEAQAIYTHPAAHPAPIIQFVNDVYDFVQNKMQGYGKGDPITPAYLEKGVADANNAIEWIQAWQQNYPAGAEFIPAIQAYSEATANLVAALESAATLNPA